MEENKSGWSKYGPLMVVVMMGMSFALGAYWSKDQYLKNGVAAAAGTNSGTGANAGAKAGNLVTTFADYAKTLKMDTKKFTACVNSGSKKAMIDADAKEGENYGVQGTPGFFINGKFLGGAFPVADFKSIIDRELAGTGSTNASAYSESLQGAAKSSPPAFNPVPKAISLGNAPVLGQEGAKVTIVEYSDFQCPFCERGSTTLKQVMSDYGGQVRLVFKHFPLTQIHPNAVKASEAAECAREQGKFWEFHDLLFSKQSEWSGLAQS